jgi:hypothetical protein
LQYSLPRRLLNLSPSKGAVVKFIITKDTQDFIAKYLGDLSKAILTVGLASYFFEKMPLLLRVGFLALAIVFLVASVIILERKGK